MFKNKVIIFYTKEELEEACRIFPDIFIKDEYFYFYFSGKFEFPMMVWNFENNNLYHTYLNGIKKYSKFYIEKIRQSIDWKDFIQETKESLDKVKKD